MSRALAVDAARDAGPAASTLAEPLRAAPPVAHPGRADAPRGSLDRPVESPSNMNWLSLGFGLGAATSFALLAVGLSTGQRVAVETHWGGLGGSLGGVRISTPLVYFALTFVFAILAYQANRTAASDPASPERRAASISQSH